MTELKSSKEYLLNLQKLIQKRRERFDLLYKKKDFQDDLEFEINKLSNEIEELDRKITVLTIK